MNGPLLVSKNVDFESTAGQSQAFVAKGLSYMLRYMFIRNHFIRNLVLDSQECKELLELHGKNKET